MRPAISSAAATSCRRQRDDRQVGARLRQVGQRAGGVRVEELQAAAVALRAQRLVQGPRLRGLAGRVVGRPANTMIDSGEKSGVR